MRYTFAILCLLLSGCLPGNFGMKSLPRQNLPVDKHPFVSEQKESHLWSIIRDTDEFGTNGTCRIIESDGVAVSGILDEVRSEAQQIVRLHNDESLK